MSRKEKSKLLFLFLGIALAMAVFWFVLRHFEDGTDAKIASDFLTEDVSGSAAAAVSQEPVGTLKLGGQKYDYYDDLETYLLMGTDASGDETAKGDAYQGNMADFLLVMVMNRTTKEFGFLQLNRDTMTTVNLIGKDGTGEATADIQLCTAHWYGGTPEQSCENTVKAVSHLLGGLPINGYYAINMDQIPALNHEVGGVELTLGEDFTDVDAAMKQGAVLTLTDEQAFHYIHDRYGVGDEKNISRMARQKQYMKALFVKIKDRLSEEPAFLNTLFGKYKEEATTDLTGRSLSQLTNFLNKSQSTGTRTLEGESRIGQALGDGIDHVEFYPSEDSLTEALSSLCNLQKRGE